MDEGEGEERYGREEHTEMKREEMGGLWVGSLNKCVSLVLRGMSEERSD